MIAYGEWLRSLTLPAIVAVLALSWSIWKHYSDKAEKRAEAERAREESISIKHVTVDDASPSLSIRIGNDGTRAVVLETVDFFWKAVDSDLEATARALPATTWCAARVDGDAAMTVPIEPGRTRNFAVKICRTQREIAQLTSAVHARTISFRFVTENRRRFEFGVDCFGDALLQLLSRIEDRMRRERIEPER